MNKKELKQSAPKFFRFLLKHEAVIAYVEAWDGREDKYTLVSPCDRSRRSIISAFGWSKATSEWDGVPLDWCELDDLWKAQCDG